MKIPEKAPEFVEIFKTNTAQVLAAMTDPQVIAFLNKEELEYNYWSAFKNLSMPKGMDPRIVWTCREVRRTGKLVLSPIKNRSADNFGYILTSAIEQTLHQTDRNMPFITEDMPEKQSREAVLIHSLMEEAIASSQIEGAAATRRKAKEMLASNSKPADRSEQMILNNYKAISHIRQLKEKPLSVELLLELHRILCERTLPEGEIGRFRISPQDDNVSVYDADGTVLYMPPPGGEIPGLLADLIKFANDDGGPFVHPLIKGILLHFWLAWIHPFCDGNGRTARAIFYWYMLKKKYWAFEYLSISRIVLNKEGQYKRAFLHTELSGDLTYFLAFNARIINEAALEITEYIKAKLRDEQAGALLLERFPGLNPRQRALLLHARRHPAYIYTIRGHQGLHNVSYATARADILGLVAAGLFTKAGGAKTQEFLAVQEKIKE